MRGADLVWREADSADAQSVIAAIDAWWPGLHMVHGVCPQLFRHVGDSCILVEHEDRLIGFLVGFVSQRLPDSGYIHYAGVHPDHRGAGLGREMYRRFAALTRARGRTEVFAETGAWNLRSIAFHRRLGFVLVPGDEIRGEVPVHRDATGHGFDCVEMVWPLDEEPGG